MKSSIHSKIPLAQEETALSVNTTNHFGLIQTQIAVPVLRKNDQVALDELASMELYVGGRPLSLFDEPWMKGFLHRLNTAYKVPSHTKFAGPLLDQAYDKVKHDTQVAVNDSSYLNLITDGSSNINHERMTNISCHTELGALHLSSQDIPTHTHDAQALATYMDTQIRIWIHDKLQRVNSLAVDTENKMRKMIQLLEKTPGWEHVFFVPCDSHGCQLLMKDISEMPWFAPIFKKAQMVATYFHKADKQLAILRMYQLRGEQKRVFSITLSCITRWGTQVGLIKSLLRSQMSLRLWCIHDQVADTEDDRGLNQQAVIDAIITHQF